MSTTIAWLQAHGGIFAVLMVAVALYNIFFSAMAQIFATLGKQEPAWAQNAGAFGLKVTQWLSANTPTPSISTNVQQAPPANSSTK